MGGWATSYINKLKKGKTVQFRPRGNSMRGKIESGELCTVEPVRYHTLKVGDIVLCKVKGNHYLHLIKAIKKKSFQIGNNKGGINGWIGLNSIYGKLVHVGEYEEDDFSEEDRMIQEEDSGEFDAYEDKGKNT